MGVPVGDPAKLAEAEAMMKDRKVGVVDVQ